MQEFKKTLTKVILNKLFSLRIIGVVIWLLITFFSAFYLKYFRSENIKDIVPLVTCSIIIMTLIYHMINYEHNLRKFNHDIKIARETLSFTTATEWHKPTMIEHLVVICFQTLDLRSLITTVSFVILLSLFKSSKILASNFVGASNSLNFS